MNLTKLIPLDRPASDKEDIELLKQEGLRYKWSFKAPWGSREEAEIKAYEPEWIGEFYCRKNGKDIYVCYNNEEDYLHVDKFEDRRI